MTDQEENCDKVQPFLEKYDAKSDDCGSFVEMSCSQEVTTLLGRLGIKSKTLNTVKEKVPHKFVPGNELVDQENRKTNLNG